MSEMMTEKAQEANATRTFFEGLIAGKRWVAHRESGVVGLLKKFHEPGEFKAPEAENPVGARVAEFENGHAFITTDRSSFEVLSEKEAALYLQATAILTHAATELVRVAASMGIDPERGMALLRDAYRSQHQALAR